MRQLQTPWPSRTQAGNRTLERLNSGARHPSKQRIAELLVLLQQLDRAEQLFWQDLSSRMGIEGWNQSTEEFRELWQSPEERKYYALLSRINRLLRRYHSVPVLLRPFFDVDELTGLRFSWELEGGGRWENWENAAVTLILDVIDRREFRRLRKCLNCSKWFYGRTDHQVHCSDNCRKQYATKDPRFKERRRLYMAQRRRREKALDKMIAQGAREISLASKHRRLK